MSTTFISHRMFVAALNHENRAPERKSEGAVSTDANGRSATRSSNQLTVEQFAAFATRYWPDFPFGRNAEHSAF